MPDPAEAVVAWLMCPNSRHQELPDLEDWITRPPWQARAACRGEGAARWIAGRGKKYDGQRATCAACLVRAECLDYALANQDLTGLWGGTTDSERRGLRRREE